MTDPKENEEINEELSTDELKSVIGGLSQMNPFGVKEKGLKKRDSLEDSWPNGLDKDFND